MADDDVFSIATDRFHRKFIVKGCIAVGLFAKPSLVGEAYGEHGHYGVFYNVSDWNLFACQICGVLWIIGWVAMVMT